MRPISILTAGVLLAGSLVACGSGQSDRHCELDSTDEHVSDTYCDSGTGGYEWEYDGESQSHRQKRLKARRTTPPRTIVVPRTRTSQRSTVRSGTRKAPAPPRRH